MKFALSFLAKFAKSIGTISNCFGQVIFKGYLPFWGDERLNSFVDGVLKIRRKDFLPLLEGYDAKAFAEDAGRP